MIHTPIHSMPDIVDITIYYICAGSLYLSYKLFLAWQKKFNLQIKHLYCISIIINLTIIVVWSLLHPKYLRLIFIYEKPILYSALITTIGAFLAIKYIHFENILVQINKKIPSLMDYPISTISLIVITCGILEEITFRGIINQISFMAPGHFGWLFCFIGIFLFGLSHIFSGWIQFFSKLILGVYFTLLYFVSGSIITPAVAHAAFNYVAEKKSRALSLC